MLTLKCIAGDCDVCTLNVPWTGRAEYTQCLSQFKLKLIIPDILSCEQNIPKHNYSFQLNAEFQPYTSLSNWMMQET